VEEVLLTGASGNIGLMLAAQRDAFDAVRQSIRTRDEVQPAVDPRCTLLLHLANNPTDVDANLRMHRKLAAAIDNTNINSVILPLSFSTLGDLSSVGPNPGEINFGFRLTMEDPYPQGKFKAEEFWINWQSQNAERRLLLLYIPIIVGPHSAWTNDIARYAPDQILVVPKLERFFGILEEELVAMFRDLFEKGLNKGVERRFAFTICGGLGEMISRDRIHPVKEVELPAVFNRLCSLAEKNRTVERFLCVHLKLLRIVMRRLSRRNIAPLSPKYFKLFMRQDAIADRLSEFVQLPIGQAS
jgi:hypothetical protein